MYGWRSISPIIACSGSASVYCDNSQTSTPVDTSTPKFTTPIQTSTPIQTAAPTLNVSVAEQQSKLAILEKRVQWLEDSFASWLQQGMCIRSPLLSRPSASVLPTPPDFNEDVMESKSLPSLEVSFVEQEEVEQDVVEQEVEQNDNDLFRFLRCFEDVFLPI